MSHRDRSSGDSVSARSRFTRPAPSTRWSGCRASSTAWRCRFVTRCCPRQAPMPSDFEKPRRLHPVSVLFNLAGEVKAFAFPAIVLFFGAGASDSAWRLAGALLMIPASLAAIVRYFHFTYTYGPDELIVRSGLVFKNERHIPYARIQNIDAAQNLAHALFGVYRVALETGSGNETEAALSVMPEQALDEMRRRVFEGRHAAREEPSPVVAESPAPAPEPAPTVLLRLGLRDLAICGLVRGKGLL